MHVDELLACWERADDDARAAGATWYRRARREARSIARDHGLTVAAAAGIIAATSPRLRWGVNVRVARAIAAGVDRPAGVVGANARKACAIRDGGRPLDILGGLKVRAFYRAIMGDESASVPDVWMHRAAGCEPAGATLARAIHDAIIAAAGAVGASTAVFQATVWVVVRGSAD